MVLLSSLSSIPNSSLIIALLLPLAARIALIPQSTPFSFLVHLSCCIAIAAYYATSFVVPRAGAKLINKLSGVDLGKWPRQSAIPQGLGLVSGTAFLICLILTQAIAASKGADCDKTLMDKYDTLMLSVCLSVLLGLADDIMDIRWAHKLAMGLIMGLPLAVQYDGPTSILIPKPFRLLIDDSSPINPLLKMFEIYPSPNGAVLELFKLYLAYVVALSVFCTNAINIYAGINGLEVGQAVVAACGVVWMDLSEIFSSPPDSTNTQNHIFSLTVMIPFIATSLGLLRHNWYPAKVFIGDTYPYYAGMTFAATAILGHYSRSLLLLLIPQVLNYLYSLPQLFGYVPCPRHRLPKVNEVTCLLEPSTVANGSNQANMTLICLALRVFGPMNERSLTITLLAFQVLCTAIGLAVRGVLAQFF